MAPVEIPRVSQRAQFIAMKFVLPVGGAIQNQSRQRQSDRHHEVVVAAFR
jgi:hypothetical protein